MKIIELSKKIEDRNGEVVVRSMLKDIEAVVKEDGIIVAEMVTQGCVVGFWDARLVDGTQWMAEFHEVHDRLTSLNIEPENLSGALYWGRRIADTLIDFYFN